MVKNTFGGFKGKTFARKLSKPSSSLVRLPQDDLELFGCVSRLLGNGRVIVHLLDGKDIQCVIRNKFRGRSKRNNLITIGSFVLIGLHDWEAPNFKNADILNVYSYDDVIYLKSLPNLNLSSLDSFLYNLNPSSSIGNEFVSFSNDESSDTIVETSVDDKKESGDMKEESDIVWNIDDI
jgi:translation initiation factor IF-1